MANEPKPLAHGDAKPFADRLAAIRGRHSSLDCFLVMGLRSKRIWEVRSCAFIQGLHRPVSVVLPDFYRSIFRSHQQIVCLGGCRHVIDRLNSCPDSNLVARTQKIGA